MTHTLLLHIDAPKDMELDDIVGALRQQMQLGRECLASAPAFEKNEKAAQYSKVRHSVIESVTPVLSRNWGA